MNKSILLISLLIAINAATFDLETARADMLTRHNYYRSQHQVGSLTRSSEIEAYAQNYSNYLVSINSLTHSQGPYGENLYLGPKGSSIGVSAVDMWYEEVSDYDFSNPGYKSGIGHFTQLVWKNSKYLGCGVGCGSNNYCFVSCNYSPAGNYLGQFASNVFPKVDGNNPGTTAPDTTAPDTTAPDTTAPDTTEQQATVTPSDDPLEIFREEITERHNYYRAQHQVGNLVRDSELERIAQEAAEYMIQTDSFYFTSEKYYGKSIGQNLYYRWGTLTGNHPVDSWYSKSSSYDYNNPTTSSFTQLVWKDSQKLGCGYACSGKECYICCTYYPPGNYPSRLATNVFPKA